MLKKLETHRGKRGQDHDDAIDAVHGRALALVAEVAVSAYASADAKAAHAAGNVVGRRARKVCLRSDCEQKFV